MSLRPVAQIGGDGFDFDEPKYLSHDGRRRLWLVDEYNNRLVVLAPDRRRIDEIFSNKSAPFAGNMLHKPESIFISGDTIWLADTHNDRVLRLRIGE